MFEQLPDFLTVPELARLLRIGRNKAYQLVREKKIPAIWLGRSPRVPRYAIMKFVELNTRSSSKSHTLNPYQ